MMKIGVISDIHGNLPALKAALAWLETAGAVRYLCLGDVAVFGPQPGACVARLRELDCHFVMGNTDAYALAPYPLPVRDEESTCFNAVESWSAALLDEKDKAFLASFAPTHTVTLTPAESILAYHGSPRSYHDPITPESGLDALDGFFDASAPELLAGGHVHQQFLRPYRGRRLFNPGSVGLPWQRSRDGERIINPSYAEFAVIETNTTPVMLSFHRAPYDLADLVAAVQSSGMPEPEWWLRHWEQRR